MKLTYQYSDAQKESQIEMLAEPDGDGWRIRLPDGSEQRIQIVCRPNALLEIHVVQELPEDTENTEDQEIHKDNESEQNRQYSFPPERILRIPVARTERGIEVAYRGEVFVFTPAASRVRRSTYAAASGALTAPMVGVVADVLVKEGEQVAAYQPLAVVEAMKVMATLEAPFAGSVERVYVQKGARVAHGAPMIDIKPNTPES